MWRRVEEPAKAISTSIVGMEMCISKPVSNFITQGSENWNILVHTCTETEVHAYKDVLKMVFT